MSEAAPRQSRESAKQRARRIPLDYYKGLTRLDAVKWLLTLGAAAVTSGYVLWTLLGLSSSNELAARQFSPAPVTSVHAVWDGNCAACHVAGIGLRQDGQAVSVVMAALAGTVHRDHKANDARCQTCHAGPPHHTTEMAGEAWSCAGCHRDHQGRDADLTRVADAACTRCHADMAAHRNGPRQVVAENVTSFPAGHPKFQSLAGGDPGRLKFNHRLHLLPGQYAAGSKASGPKRLDDIDRRYWGEILSAVGGEDARNAKGLTLNCAYCHQADATVPASGAYMQPIDFERHCAACHNGDLTASVATAGAAAEEQLPHGLPPEAIRQFLAGLAAPPSGSQQLGPAQPLQPIPGKTPGHNLAQTTEPSAAARVSAAEMDLRGEHRCGKCHEFSAAPEAAPLAVEPTNLPAVWLRHARFDHSAHRAMRCEECHEASALRWEGAGKPPLDGGTPMIPDIDNCRRCHAPTTALGTTGARHDCAECHQYHGGDLPPHGRGANQRGVLPSRRLEGLKWLSAEPPPSSSRQE